MYNKEHNNFKASKRKILNSVNSLLLLIICAFFLSIAVLSLIFFISESSKNKKAVRQVIQASSKNESPVSSTANFNDWGRLRTITKDKIPVVISPVIEYEKDNKPLHEEFCQKESKIKSIVTNYFNNKTKEQLLQMNEQTIKAQITRQLNQELSMGNINALYFEEYILLD